MKKKRLLSIVMAFAMIVGFAAWVPDLEALAASNPYPINGINGSTGEWSNCTWSVWKLVKDNLGIELPSWGWAGDWLDNANNSGYKTGSTPAKNSIVVYKNGGHVAFVTDVSSDGSQIYIKEGGYGTGSNLGYHEGWSTSSGIRYGSQSVCGYIYLVSSGTKPSWAKVSVPKSTFAVGEDITFTLTSDSGKAYTVGIDDASGNRIHTYGSPIRSDTTTQVYTYRISKPGNYSCYITAHNDIGLCDSDRIYFSVATKPSWAKVSIPKSTFTIGEDITFTLTSDSGKSYTVGIDDASGNRIHTYGSPIRSDTTTQVYTYRISKPGNYSCYITAHNDIGLCDSERIYFKIAQPVDLGDHFYANITNNDLQKMTCNGDVTFDSTYKENDQIWYFIKQNDGSYMIQSLSSGAYNGWYLEVANGGTDPGTNISTMYKWLDDNPAQKWYVYGEQNAYILKPKCADLVVTSADNSSTGVSNAQLEKYTGNSSQLLEVNKLCDKNEGIHSYNEWVVNKEATCEENGQKQHKCKWCGNTEKEVINKLGHNYVETVVAPTCTAKGYTNHKCSRCGDEYNDTETQMTSHSFGDWRTTTAPTCTEKGVETRTCSVCKASESREIKALGHDYVASIVPPTCTSKGYTNHKCTRCKDEYNDTETDMLAHSFGDWRVTTAPTCTAKGVETRTCSECKKTETRDVNALGHDYVASIIPPTCQSKGYTLHKCLRCNDEYKDNETNMAAHSFGKWTTTVIPTCTAKGSETRICSVCKVSETREIKALGHDYVASLVSANCNSKGYTLYKCSRCGDEIKDNYTEPTGNHKWSEWKTTAFDVTKGTSTQTRTCSTCNKTESKTTENAIMRLAGSGRYETAAKISQAAFDQADTVVLAYGLNYADALAGVSLATKLKAPILLTNTKTLDATTLAEIKRLKAKNVIILGGTGAVGAEVETALIKEGFKTERIAGATRFETATKIAEKMQKLNDKAPEEVYFVYAFNSADALSVSAVAAVKGAPVIYLKTTGDLDDATAAYLRSIKDSVKNAYVIGGEGVISNDMMKKAGNALGVTPVRVFGANRFATCVAVNEKFADVLNGDMLCVATGMDFPDALAGGVYAALNKAPLFLINGKLKTPQLSDEQKAYLKTKAAGKITAFGGTGVVSDNHIADIAKNSV